VNKVDIVESARLRTDIPPFRPGDQVKVHVNIREGGRERVQVFEGVVIARRGGGLRESFTVRKISFGVGVERTFPIHAPAIAKLEVVRHGKVRRAKLYYLRELTGKKAKIDERRTRIPTWEQPSAGAAEAEAAEAEAAEAETAEVTAAETADAAAEQPVETAEATGSKEAATDVTEAPAGDAAEGAEASDGGSEPEAETEAAKAE